MEATHLFNKLKKYTEWTDEKCFVYANIADSLIECSESIRKFTQNIFDSFRITRYLKQYNRYPWIFNFQNFHNNFKSIKSGTVACGKLIKASSTN